MPEVAEVFRRYGAAYRERFGARMLPSHCRAMDDLVRCRTAALGGHVLRCEGCARVEYAYHSCLNRSCPKCAAARTRAWLDKQRRLLLPVGYFHLVFTLPEPLRQMVRSHQRVLLPILFRAAAQSLRALAKDPRYLGGTPAILAVLHTWTRALVYHPHIHCLVSAGGIDDEGGWRPARSRFLVPVRALSLLFRGKLMALARKALPQEHFPSTLWKKPWVVYAKPSLQGAERVLAYLARYVRRIAISNERLLAIEHHRVTFRYRDSRQRRTKTMTLPAHEFIRRFLQHVLPKGLHKVRAYGLLSPSYRSHLRRLQATLSPPAPQPPASAQPDAPAGEARGSLSDPDGHGPQTDTLTEARRCPDCGGRLFLIDVIHRPARSPP